MSSKLENFFGQTKQNNFRRTPPPPPLNKNGIALAYSLLLACTGSKWSGMEIMHQHITQPSNDNFSPRKRLTTSKLKNGPQKRIPQWSKWWITFQAWNEYSRERGCERQIYIEDQPNSQFIWFGVFTQKKKKTKTYSISIVR